MSDRPRLRVGVSSCLLGQEVRYDGGHKRDRFVLESLGPLVEWVPVCPEMELGLGVPRPTLRIEERRGSQGLHLVMPKTGRDWSAPMRRYARERCDGLAERGLSGYVFKKDSPSCGVRSVKIYPEDGPPRRGGRGLFAEAVVSRFPHLPFEDEGRLHDARLRENFVTHLFAYRAWQDLEEQGPTRGSLMEFHQRHKFVLMARSQDGMRRLGRLLGSADKRRSASGLARDYLEGLTAVMRRAPTRKNHTNVLHHLAGFVSDALDAGDRKELAESIDEYRLGHVPLIVPVTLLRHHARRANEPYLAEQVYLYSHPQELMLLNQL